VLDDGSFLSRIDELVVRVIDADLTIATDVETRTTRYRLITTLLDPDQARAADLIELYHRRWEIETAYCELKSSILGGRVLRGRYPAAIEQQVWALLTCYQAIRTAMIDAIIDRPDIAADRLSFSIAHATARDELVRAADTPTTDTSTDLVGAIGTAVLAQVMPDKRVRTGPRAIKRALSKHRAKGHIERCTRPATLTVRLLTNTTIP